MRLCHKLQKTVTITEFHGNIVLKIKIVSEIVQGYELNNSMNQIKNCRDFFLCIIKMKKVLKNE